MTAREYLSQIEKLDRQISTICEEIEKLRSLASGVTSTDSSSERVQTSMTGDKLCSDVTKIVMLTHEMDELTDEFYDLKSVALRFMGMMKNKKQYNILYERYINYKSIYTIAKEKKKNYQNMKKLHLKALQEYQKILDLYDEN